MRKVIVSEFVTLDGVMEDPGGAENFERGGWAFQFDRGPEGDMPKYVVSTTMEQAAWNNSILIKTNVAGEVSRLKELPGRDILVAGSSQLVAILIQHDLVDEIRLMVFPVLLGCGKRLFTDRRVSYTLQLVESKPVGSGVLILIYHPRRN